MKRTFEVRLSTPLGVARALLHDDRVCALGFEETWPAVRARALALLGSSDTRMADVPELTAALDHYFSGGLAALDAIRAEPNGTPFQKRLWSALRAVPPGETRTYGEFAKLLGMPGAARAVGAANGQNPIALLIPCHRLVGSDGALTGYAWGLERKRWLLAHERNNSRGGALVATGTQLDAAQPNGERS